ncbi:hypothetical protein L1887_34226 [Cichorium endivia]|nr:hypothetical protein L1887_34226 [Cichorium endivia]
MVDEDTNLSIRKTKRLLEIVELSVPLVPSVEGTERPPKIVESSKTAGNCRQSNVDTTYGVSEWSGSHELQWIGDITVDKKGPLLLPPSPMLSAPIFSI